MLRFPLDIGRDKYLLLAKVTEKAAQHKDTTKILEKKIAKFHQDLNDNEQKVLFNAYNEIYTERMKVRSAILGFQKKLKDQDQIAFVKNYINEVEDEISYDCHDMLRLLEILIGLASTSQSKVRYLGRKAHCYTNLAHLELVDSQRLVHKNKARDAYQTAEAIAKKSLSPLDFSRLVSFNNYAAFLNDVMNLMHEALSVVHEAIAEAKAVGSETEIKSNEVIATMERNEKAWISQLAANDKNLQE